MGCDIHAFAERKSEGKWKQIKREFKHNTFGEGYYFEDELDMGRNYELFAFLADVRNSDGIIPISQPKGIPEDASLGYLAEVEDWDGDGHSHSYFTLAELKTIPRKLLNQKINDRRIILAKDDKGQVTETCRGTNGKNLGEVGERKIFTLFQRDKTPIQTLIEELEEVRYENEDDEIRLVFFFDN